MRKNIENPNIFPGRIFLLTMTLPQVGLFQWTLMDELEVPSNLSPGDYVLSFRSNIDHHHHRCHRHQSMLLLMPPFHVILKKKL